MQYKSYQHIEKLGTSEVQNIEYGLCHVFPKIDGTNASVWLGDCGNVKAGSRNRELSIESDNAGFYAWVIQQQNIVDFLSDYPELRLFGEWLVPHSLKTYREDTWRRFYVFDVCKDGENDTVIHAPYETYKPILERYNIDFIPPICTITNGSYEQFINQLALNVFLIEDGKGAGEGIVIKRYDYRNKYGRQTWAKIVTSEFKEKHAKEMGGHVLNGKKLVEEEIADKYVTTALCEKEYAKICLESDWTSKMIPRLLHTVFYSLVKEDCWEFIKEHKNPNIDFKRLQHFCFAKTKERLPQLF